jgi:hypothetical protein
MFNFAVISSMLGFDHIKDMYREDPNFKGAYEACENLVMEYRSQWME